MSKHATDTQKNNAKFLALSRPEQRRAIVLDAIAQLKAGKYLAGHAYFWLKADGIAAGQELQEVISKKKTRCHVCGIGACFASAVRLSDDLQINRLMIDDHDDTLLNCTRRLDLMPKLRDFFSEQQIDRIEAAYEVEQHRGWKEDLHYFGKAERFGLQFKSDKKRMIAILQKIADHPRALFVP